jgi:hypothetical protein
MKPSNTCLNVLLLLADDDGDTMTKGTIYAGTPVDTHDGSNNTKRQSKQTGL